MGWLRPAIVLSFLTVAFGETFLRPHIKSQNFADKNLYCAGDVNNVCLSGLCYDSINLLDQRISSGCATGEMCAKTECKLFETKFVCCCSGTVCNGKSASLLRSRLRIEQERIPPPIIYKIDGNKARLIPRDVKVEQQPKKQEKMIEYEEKEGLSEEKFEENKEKAQENEKAAAIAEVQSIDNVEKPKIELNKEEFAKEIQPIVRSSEELPAYIPEMATKGMPVKKVDPTQKVEPAEEKEEDKVEELPKIGEMKAEEVVNEAPVQENPVITNQEIKEDFVVEKKEAVKLESTTEAKVEEPNVESNAEVEENVELKTMKPMEKPLDSTETSEDATTQAAKQIPLTEGPTGGVGLGEDDRTTTAAPKEPYLPPIRLPIKSDAKEETGSTEKKAEEPTESHGADDVFFKPVTSAEKVEVNDAVVAGVKIQAEEPKAEKVEEVVKDTKSAEGEEKEEESEERPELGLGAGDDKSEEAKPEARPLSNKESVELDGDPLPASKPKRTTAEQPIKKASSGALIPAIVILVMLALIAGGGFVLWRKKKINPKRRNQQQKKDTELVLVDPLLRQNQEKVANETPIEAPSQA